MVMFGRWRLYAFALLIVLACTPGSALADTLAESIELDCIEVKDTSLTFNSVEDDSVDDEASVKQELVLNGETYRLLPTFDDPVQALKSAAKENALAFDYLKAEYGLGSLSANNWEEYQDALEEKLGSDDCPEWFSSFSLVYPLRAFFDIYENEDSNAEILTEAKSLSEQDEITGDDLSRLLNLLPDQGVLGQSIEEEDRCVDIEGGLFKQQESINLAASAASSFSVGEAVSYAYKYAPNPNTSSYRYFPKGDCTNFASQVLYAGGMKQIPTTSNNRGWWHKSRKIRGKTCHYHSTSWINANTFAKYMGVGYKTRSNSYFSKNIKAGDFIAADWKSDGTWDHIGFVVAKSSKKTSGYYDYKVAQHTRNYCAWTSSSTNEWEKAGNSGASYGRIRR